MEEEWEVFTNFERKLQELLSMANKNSNLGAAKTAKNDDFVEKDLTKRNEDILNAFADFLEANGLVC